MHRRLFGSRKQFLEDALFSFYIIDEEAVTGPVGGHAPMHQYIISIQHYHFYYQQP
jgi:hypothetical protein